MLLKCGNRKEHQVFQQLLQTIPHLQECLMESEQADLQLLLNLYVILLIILKHTLILQIFRKGVSSARYIDTKSLKGGSSGLDFS